MAIISILMAVLMPTLNRARELVRSVVCKSNERGLGNAFSMYAAAWNDKIPPVGSAYYEFLNCNYGAYYQFSDTTWYHLFGWMGLIGSRERFQGKVPGVAFWNNRYAVTHCPAEGNPISPTNNLGTIYYDSALAAGSYVMNGSVCGGYYGQWYAINLPPVGVPKDCYRPGWSLGPGDPNYTSSTGMIVTDICDQGAGWLMPLYNAYIDVPTSFDVEYYTFRHADRTANFLFMDGHVGSKKSVLDTDENVFQYLWHEYPPSRR